MRIKPFLASALFIFFLLLINSSAFSQEKYLLSPEKFKATTDKKPMNVIIVDVRTPEEYGVGRIENSINIDIKSDDFADSISSLDKSKVYFLYCNAGTRSSRARNTMKEAGFAYVFELDGGMDEWLNLAFPVVTTVKN